MEGRRVEGNGGERGGNGSRIRGKGEDRLQCHLKGGLSQPNGGNPEADTALQTGPQNWAKESDLWNRHPSTASLRMGHVLGTDGSLQPRQFLKGAES